MPPPAPPSPAPAARPLSAWSLPGHTLRILGSCLLSLVLWFAAGQAVRSALMWAATEVAHGDHRQVRFGVVMFLFTLIVLTKLVVTVGMLHSVRGSLREIRARRAGDEADESLFGALDRSTLVFATIYIAWSFYAEDARELIALDAMKRIDQDFAGSFAGIKGEGGDLLIGLEVWLSAVVAVIAYLLKMLFAWWHTNGKGKASGILTAFFELAFAFYGINAIFELVSARSEWLDGRVATATVKGWLEHADKTIPGWKAFWETVADVWPFIVDALVEPLTWLTVAALVYGAFAQDTRAVVRGTRLDTVADRMDRTHALTRTTVTRSTTGFQERWIPPANAFRLVTRGGAALFGMFCLCYVVIHVGTEYADRAARALVGNDSPFFWLVFGSPLDFVRELLAGMLTVCLLAATFDIAATRSREAGRALGA
ncbi:hypothetical protein Plo01_24560 [Planobispora longispora]|uniref:Uncharacterized protein n=1 Tax=Planobispora longispora TaxID=28887 RepID=A0A8J3RHW9_9ACTN|nr:hypothetical protein Plo01_24560 [Planobispora longispora]